MKKLKKLLAGILTLLIILSSIPMAGFAASAADTPEIKLGDRLTLSLEEGVETIYKFIPQETKRYALESFGDGKYDIKCILYDSNFEYITEDDDLGEGRNFMLTHELEAGKTYYYKIVSLYDEWGIEFDVELTCAKNIKKAEVTTLPTKTEYYANAVNQRIDLSGMVVTVTWNDDTAEEYIFDDYDWNFKGYTLYCDSSNAETTKKVLLTLGDCEFDFNIDIVENPVASIEIADNSDVPFTLGYEQGGYWDWYYDENGDEVDYYYYEFNTYNCTCTINYKDGTSKIIENLNDDLDGYYVSYRTDQYGSPWTMGGKNNYIYFEYAGVEVKKNVNIVESIVTSLEVVKIDPITECVDGDYEYTYDEDNNEIRYFNYNVNYDNLELKVTYYDGTTKTGTVDAFDGMLYYDHQHFSPWVLGGENNIVTFVYYDSEFDYNVILSPNPIQSITIIEDEIKPIIEHTGGYWQGDNYVYYVDFHDIPVKVTYNDGREPFITTVGDINGANIFYDQYTTPWTVGGTNNTITITAFGKTVYYNVKIVENPVESFEIINFAPLEEGKYGHITTYYDEETGKDVPYFFYYVESQDFDLKVHYKDGSSEIVTEPENSDHLEFDSLFSQYNAPWTVGGDNILEVKYYGVSLEYNVTINPSNVEKIEIIDTNVEPLHENVQGYFTSNESGQYFEYYLDCEDYGIEVTYDDGTTATFYGFDKKHDDAYVNWVEDQYYSPWTVGGENNTVLFYYRGATVEYNVEVIENPVESIEITKLPDVNSMVYGDPKHFYVQVTNNYYFNYEDIEGMEITLNMTDGTTEKHIVTAEEVDDRKINGYEYELYYNNEPNIGTNSIGIYYRGFSTTFDVTLTESNVEKVEIIAPPTNAKIRNDYFSPDYIGMKIKVTYKDGTAKDVTVSSENLKYVFYNGITTLLDIDGRYAEIYSGLHPSVSGYFTAVAFLGATTSMKVIECEDENAYVKKVNVLEFSSDGNIKVEVIIDDKTKEYTLAPFYTIDASSEKYPEDYYYFAETEDGILSYNIYSTKSTTPSAFSRYSVVIFNSTRTINISGDVNEDGERDLNDVVLLAQYCAGWDVECDDMAANVNGDDTVDLNDVVLLAQYCAGWDVKLNFTVSAVQLPIGGQ